LKSDRFYLDEKRKQQEEELELATMNVDKSHGSRGRRRRRREKRIKNRMISELPSYAQKVEGLLKNFMIFRIIYDE
jgi:hypothetical protein